MSYHLILADNQIDGLKLLMMHLIPWAATSVLTGFRIKQASFKKQTILVERGWPIGE